MDHERKFLLKDEDLPDKAGGKWGKKNMGKCMCLMAESMSGLLLNPTKPTGGTTGILYGVLFDANKDGWKFAKVKEAMEVSPVHQQYYQLTTKQKEELEGRIKQGLAGIAQSVSDLELVEHDIRKYEDYQKDLKASREEKNASKKREAQMRLKAVFVDEVDHHAGGSRDGGAGRLSMAFMRNNNIMPTIVDDFMEMDSAEDLKKKDRLKNIPTVEKRMLEVKFRAYEDWLKVFESTINKRLERMHQLKRSREKTLEEYRDWLKPYILRHKFIEEMYQHEGERKGKTTHFLRSQANAVSFGEAVVWLWKALYMAEDRPQQAEDFAKAYEEKVIRPIDTWSEKTLIFNFRHGLIADYPWMTFDWVWGKDGKGGQFKSIEGKLSKLDPYYNFFHLKYEKTLIRFPSGDEAEDGDFMCRNYVFSMNIMGAKLLEQAAIEQETENYIDDVLGVAKDKRSIVSGRTVIGFNKKWGKYQLDKHFLGALHHGYAEWHPALAEAMKKEEWEKLFEGKEKGHDDHGRKHGSSHGEEKPRWVSKKEFFAAFGKDEKDAEKRFYFVEQPTENEKMSQWLKLLGFAEPIEFNFFRSRGPYENSFKERVTKFYFKWADAKWSGILNSIEKRMNIAGTKAGGGH